MHTFHRSHKSSRHGLTILEFIGCLIAVVGGVWLGAVYLGVDVHNATYTALADTQLLDKMPESWRPKPPADEAMTREQLVTTLREELGSLRNQISALHTGDTTSTSDTAATPANDNSQLLSHEASLAYWLRLNEIALGEADLQSQAEAAFNADNAAKVFAIKGRICRFAAKAVVAVPTAGVDETAVRFGRALGLWYDRGGELYEKATRIWETPVGPQARTQLNSEWKQDEEQHRNEARLLHQKASAARGSLTRIYGNEFPEFAQPFPAESP